MYSLKSLLDLGELYTILGELYKNLGELTKIFGRVGDNLGEWFFG